MDDKVRIAIIGRLGLELEDEATVDEHINGLTNYEKLDHYLKWNGLLGSWTSNIAGAIKSIYKVEIRQ